MTKEEAIQIIDSLDPAVMIKTTASNKQIREAIDMAVGALSQPSLPPDLDEAAEKEFEDYISSNFLDIDIIWARMPLTKKFGNQMFKAGAEWMAGQFQKIDGDLVDWYSTSDGKDYCCGVKTQDAFEVPEGFYIKKK